MATVRSYSPSTGLRVFGGGARDYNQKQTYSRQAGRPREIFEISGQVVKELEKVEVDFSRSVDAQNPSRKGMLWTRNVTSISFCGKQY